jgi:CPA2 family monovalent cation:H+ antiporter-2
MENTGVFLDLATVLAFATATAFVFSKLKLSVVSAFLAAGAFLGPGGAGLVTDRAMVDSLAEVGVVLLLFTVGLEFSFTSLGRMGKQILLSGAAQIGFCVLFTIAASLAAGVPLEEAIFLGFFVSLSSTAIVLKLYTDRSEIDTTHGRTAFGILLFQDLAVIPMMLLIPSLARWDAADPAQVLLTLAKAGGAVAAVLVSARFLIPRVMREIVRLDNREVFLLSILFVCLGTAYLSHILGLSLGMGAFLAGMVIADSEYVHEITAQVVPFRDVFSGVFFVSIGMLLDARFLAGHLPLVLSATAAVVAVKVATTGLAVRLRGHSVRASVMVGLGLAQVGEFSFLLLSQGAAAGLLATGHQQLALGVAILSMVATPFLVQAAPSAGRAVEKLFFVASREDEEEGGGPSGGRPKNHVIVAGYGVNGKNLVRVLRSVRLPYVVVELNDLLVEEARKAGETIVRGPVDRPETLRRAGVEEARMVVLAISDPIGTRRAVAQARHLNGTVGILVRTKYVADVDDLLSLGANAVIPEEFETSVEIFSRVLAEYHVPDHVIRQQEQLVRSGTYRILRERSAPRSEEVLAEFEEFLRRKVIEIFYVAPGCPWERRTVADVPAGGESGVVLLAILREERALVQPPATERLAAGDKLVLFGGHAALAEALSGLSCPPPSAEADVPAGDAPPEGAGG